MRHNQIVTVIGRKGSGKSHFVKNWLLPIFLKRGAVVVVDPMAEYGASISLRQFLINCKKSGLSGMNVIRVTSDFEADLLFRFIINNKLRLTLVVEEADKYCTATHINESLRRALNYGRHWGVNLIFIARRMSRIHRDITSQSDLFISFQQHELIDLKKLSQYVDKGGLLTRLEKFIMLVLVNVSDLMKFPEGSKLILTKNKNKWILKNSV